MPTIVRKRDIDKGATNDTKDVFDDETHYRVVGPANGLLAKVAVDDTTGESVPLRGSASPDDPRYVANEVSAERVDFSPGIGPVYDVRVRWIAPPIGPTGGTATDPTYIDYEWDFEEPTKTVSSDIHGRPFINAAGDPIQGGFALEDSTLVLRVYQTVTAYDVAAAQDALFHVNDRDMTVLGKSITAGQMICTIYKPTKRLRVGSRDPVDIVREFKFKPGYKPWQAQFQNSGFNGYDVDGQPGPIATKKDDQPIRDPIPLIGTRGGDGSLATGFGTPLYDATLYVQAVTRKALAKPPAAVTNLFTPTYPETKPSDTTPAFYRVFFDVRFSFNFVGFIPGIM